MYQPTNTKPPAFPLLQPLMPEDTAYNWNFSTSNVEGVKLFNGGIPTSSGINSNNRLHRVKRKSESDESSFFPAKQKITEEKMALYLSGMHLSDSFQAHNINLNESTYDEEEMDMSYNVNLSPQELETRLKNAKRITVCDDVKRSLNQSDEIIPKILLDRIEKPCRAVMLWSPTQPLDHLIKINFSKNSNEDMENNDKVKSDERMCE